MRILVTHASYHASVGAIKMLRKISRWPIFIIGCSSYPKGMSSGSLLVDAFYQSPPADSADEYLAFLQNLIEAQKIDFIISADENELKLFSNRLAFFREKTVVPPLDVLSLFQKKQEASCTLQRLGIEIPKILPYNELLNSQVLGRVILRENVSCCSYGIYVTDGADLGDINKHLTPTSFIQEFVSGQEYTVDVLCDRDGTPQFIIPRARLAIRNGITYKCRIEYETQLIQLCKRIYHHYRIPGFSNVQFIKAPDQTIYFIELNPRLGGTTIASSLASVNLIEQMLAHFAIGEQMLDFEYNMSLVKWNATVTRYYEETIYLEQQRGEINP